MTRLPVFLAGALAAGAAFADADSDILQPVDQELAIAIEAEVTRLSVEIWGAGAVQDTSPGAEVPIAVIDSIQATQRVPEGVTLAPAPEEIRDRLPHSQDGTEWFRLGDHLIEMTPEGIVLITVLEVLP
ncbi:MAG: hypothetical protein AAFW69_07695 [Pseudomonadota bacterium]